MVAPHFHLPHLHEVPRPESADIDPFGQVAGIPGRRVPPSGNTLNLIRTRILLFIYKSPYPLAPTAKISNVTLVRYATQNFTVVFSLNGLG